MFRVVLSVCVAALLGACHSSNVPAVSSYTSEDPTGVSPGLETINLRPDVHRALKKRGAKGQGAMV